jgi:hypothetical protein
MLDHKVICHPGTFCEILGSALLVALTLLVLYEALLTTSRRRVPPPL